jgi:hypothetical protein
VLVLAIGLAACDAVSTLTEGFKKAQAVQTDLQESTGLKPQVGFNWTNGRLVSVTVAFPGIYDKKPLSELAAIVRASITNQFQQTPETIVLSFSLAT